ncbi:DUF4097 family beta strand repeat-containing protein [Saccharomonospora sp. NPDC046836]|uniref:DUF4097 family beta strand repeat-containing protein n=1 Tax=Saccharomonospora sp. NPDC046836 TaxID=3156921 RepID=UPI0033DB5432
MGRVGLAVGGVAFIAVGAMIAFGWTGQSSAEETATETDPVRAIELAMDSGDVVIRTDDDARQTTIRQEFRYRFGEPDRSYTLDNGTLTLADCGRFCSVDYEVIVPRGVTVGGTLDSGHLVVDGVGDVRVTADSGGVRGERLRGDVEVTVDSGDVELSLVESRNVRALVDSGSLQVTVPAGAYRVEGSTDSGNREIGVVQDPAASRLLDLTTDSGDVVVHGA